MTYSERVLEENKYSIPFIGGKPEVYWKRPVFVDIETTGLLMHHEIISATIKTLDGDCAVHYQHPSNPAISDPGALRVNGYTYEKWEARREALDADGQLSENWHDFLDIVQCHYWDGHVVVGVNPTFDLQRLDMRIWEIFRDRMTCHFKPICLSNLAFALFGVCPSLDRLRDMFGIKNTQHHTAEKDVDDAIIIYKMMWEMMAKDVWPRQLERALTAIEECKSGD